MKREPKINLPTGLRIVKPWFKWLLCEGCGNEFRREPLWAATVQYVHESREEYVCFGCCRKAHSVPNFIKGFHCDQRIPVPPHKFLVTDIEVQAAKKLSEIARTDGGNDKVEGCIHDSIQCPDCEVSDDCPKYGPHKVWAITYWEKHNGLERTVAVSAESEDGAIQRLACSRVCHVLHTEVIEGRKPQWPERRIEGWCEKPSPAPSKPALGAEGTDPFGPMSGKWKSQDASGAEGGMADPRCAGCKYRDDRIEAMKKRLMEIDPAQREWVQQIEQNSADIAAILEDADSF